MLLACASSFLSFVSLPLFLGSSSFNLQLDLTSLILPLSSYYLGKSVRFLCLPTVCETVCDSVCVTVCVYGCVCACVCVLCVGLCDCVCDCNFVCVCLCVTELCVSVCV